MRSNTIAFDDVPTVIPLAPASGLLPKLGRPSVAGRYRLGALLGAGGMGEVFEAEHATLGRRVAVKILRRYLAEQPEVHARFHREARLVGRIAHPNVCSLLDYGTLDDGRPYLVMERLHGQTLAARLRARDLDANEVVGVIMQVLAGLDAAHALGVVHRDVKPDNVIVAEQPPFGTSAKLIDFGIARAGGRADITQSGAIVGTPQYISPEQIGGDDLDGRVDVFACGVILYQAFTGALPYRGRDFGEIVHRLGRGAPRRPRELRPEIPEKLERAIMKAIAADRDARHASAGELFEDLRDARADLARPARGAFAERVVASENPGKAELVARVRSAASTLAELELDPVERAHWAAVSAAADRSRG